MNYQRIKLNDLTEEYGDCNILVMHNEEKDRHLATQVSALTNDTLSYGDFTHEDGFLLNETTKTIIIYPEKSLEEQHLFSSVRNDFELGSQKIEFYVKNDESEIDYITREENKKGSIELNNKTYDVFIKSGCNFEDPKKVILLKTEKPEIKNKKKVDKINKPRKPS